jgi:hypothetical protein
MVRRSFRIGLRLGLLFGVTLALVKTVQSRRTASAVPPPAPWEPIVDTPRPSPTASVDEPIVDEVGEPIMEPSAPAEPSVPEQPSVIVMPPEEDLLHAKVEPATPDTALDVVPEAPAEVEAPVKKVAAKKLPAAKKSAAPRKAAAKKAAKTTVAALPAFVDPEGGVCPTTHPVKAKLASRLFHLPGMFAYDRTRPDRCYLDAPSAVADGFTSAKR